MKIKLTPTNQGSALLLSLLVAVILLITLTSYLMLVSDENRAVGRAQAWNAAMPIAEAGVEEALTQLQYAGSGINLATNGWALGSDGNYHKSQTLNSSSYYSVAIQPATDPIIYSTGFISAPIKGGYIGRLVKVQTITGPSFGQGITSKGMISLGGGAYLDSYSVNSNGTYSLVPGGQAVALTDTNVAGAVSLNGSPYISGYVETGDGPTSGSGATLSTIGNAVVGDTNYIASGGSSASPNVEAGHYSNNANFQFNDVSAPSFSSYYTSFGTLGSSNIAGISGQTTCYEVSSISSGNLYIYGNVTIYCTGSPSVSITGQGFIDITTNSSLTLYLAGSMSVGGGGVINGPSLAKDLTIYGLPTCTSIAYKGGADFVGVVDAPEADFKFGGNERAIGAFVVNSCTVSGTGGVHWDSSLTSTGGFLVNGWNELSLNQ